MRTNKRTIPASRFLRLDGAARVAAVVDPAEEDQQDPDRDEAAEESPGVDGTPEDFQQDDRADRAGEADRRDLEEESGAQAVVVIVVHVIDVLNLAHGAEYLVVRSLRPAILRRSG